MWPWEHVVIGYLAFSALSHVRRREPPRAGEAVLVVVASLLPDLIDKPLAWSLQIASSGYGPAHSVFFVLPALTVLCARWWVTGRPWRGVAFATGYLLHVPGDVFFNAMDGTVDPAVFLWPVLVHEPSGERAGFVAESVLRVGQFLAGLVSGDVSTYTTVQLGLLGVAALLWLYDGAPVVRQAVDRTTEFLREHS